MTASGNCLGFESQFCRDIVAQQLSLQDHPDVMRFRCVEIVSACCREEVDADASSSILFRALLPHSSHCVDVVVRTIGGQVTFLPRTGWKANEVASVGCEKIALAYLRRTKLT